MGVTLNAAERRPNVVVIVADDLGFQLGCYGDKLAKTPNIDHLAGEGTRFTRAYCTTASCSASRSVIMSGLYNHATGHYGHAHGYNHFSTYDSVKSLPVILGDAGYRTCLIGKYHLAPEYVYHFEFERQEGTQGHRNTVRMAENAREWISEKDDRPFFLYFCPTDPHRAGKGSFANHPDDLNFYPGIRPTIFQPEDITIPSWLPDQPEVRAELAEYYQSIARLDVGIGTLMQTLQDLGHAENTLVMFLSDNGPPFPGAKTTCYEPGINLPLIVRDPRVKQRGTTCDAMVTWADLTPTILDYCGIKPPSAPPVRPGENQGAPSKKAAGKGQPYQFHGKSFAKVIGGEHPPGWNEMYASHTFHEITMYYPMRVVREGQYKYIFNVAHELSYPFASDLFASPTWQGVLERNDFKEYYGRRTVDAYLHRPRHELYDLEVDPYETKNLANDPALKTTLERLQSKLQEWQKSTRDPWELKWRYE
ncbi:MAG: heparan N-sulfatase [Planctomycetales bacterium 12-60-4]|nr:MAG: heparan N-sulfatase [Planctomycetales bacterium 12-60-4]